MKKINNLIILIILVIVLLLPGLILVKFFNSHEINIYYLLSIFCIWYLSLAVFLVKYLIKLKTFNQALLDFINDIKGGNLHDGSFTQLKIGDKKLQMLLEAQRSLKNNVNLNVDELVDISGYLLNAIKDVSDVSREIAAASKAIARGAAIESKDAGEFSKFTDNLVSKIENMAQIANLLLNDAKVMTDIIKKIVSLSEQAKNISKITNVISQIARETKLLSLNASIEAARAGEFGEGFDVVAKAIRSLADQSQESSSEIDNMIIPVLEDLKKIKDVINQSHTMFEQQKYSTETAGQANLNIESFLNNFISQQMKFCNEFEKLNELKSVINQNVKNITAATEDSVATTAELATLTMTQINSTANLVDMATKLGENISEINQNKSMSSNRRPVTQKKKIAILFCIDTPFFNATIETAKKAAKMYNVEVEFFAPKVQDRDLQLAQIREVINKKFDGLAIDPNDEGREITEAINYAVKSGMKVICFDSDAPNSQRLGVIETSGVKGGQDAAKAAAKILNNQGKVIVNVWSDNKKRNNLERAEGFINEINHIPGMKAIKVFTTSDPTELEAENQIKEILANNPEFDLAYMTNLIWGFHMARFFKKYNIRKKLITFDCTMEHEDYLHDGIIQIAISQRQFIWGELAVKWLVDAMDGKDIPKYEDTGVYEVNSSNFQIFKKRFS